MYLNDQQRTLLREVIVRAGGYDGSLRNRLLAGIDAGVVGKLTTISQPEGQLQSDLDWLNADDRWETGSEPLEKWLKNAAENLTGLRGHAEIEAMVDQLYLARRIGARTGEDLESACQRALAAMSQHAPTPELTRATPDLRACLRELFGVASREDAQGLPAFVEALGVSEVEEILKRHRERRSVSVPDRPPPQPVGDRAPVIAVLLDPVAACGKKKPKVKWTVRAYAAGKGAYVQDRTGEALPLRKVPEQIAPLYREMENALAPHRSATDDEPIRVEFVVAIGHAVEPFDQWECKGQLGGQPKVGYRYPVVVRCRESGSAEMVRCIRKCRQSKSAVHWLSAPYQNSESERPRQAVRLIIGAHGVAPWNPGYWAAVLETGAATLVVRGSESGGVRATLEPWATTMAQQECTAFPRAVWDRRCQAGAALADQMTLLWENPDHFPGRSSDVSSPSVVG